MERLIKALEELVKAQERLLVCYRVGDTRRGGDASYAVMKAKARVEKARASPQNTVGEAFGKWPGDETTEDLLDRLKASD